MELLTLITVFAVSIIVLKLVLGRTIKRVDRVAESYLIAGEVHAHKLIAEQDEESITKQIERANKVRELLDNNK